MYQEPIDDQTQHRAPSFFKTPQAKRAVEELYESKLDELSITYEFLRVETSFGNTNIILTGQANKPPLILLHGANGCAPVAIEALIGLIEHFRIYAIDVVGQPNLSAEVRPDMKDNSYGQWMFEIMTRLNIQEATLVGISFGGFIGWKTLVFDERRIARAFLIVPAGIINGNPLKALWKIFLPMQLYKWRKKEHYVEQFLQALFTERDEFAIAFLSEVFLHFEMDFSPIPLISPEEAQQVKTPIHIVAAEGDLLFPGEKLLRSAQKLFPSLSETLLLKASKHVPDQAANERIVRLICNS
ncbi:MAG: alpha/beta hydrolase [Bacteroidota bacterium]